MNTNGLNTVKISKLKKAVIKKAAKSKQFLKNQRMASSYKAIFDPNWNFYQTLQGYKSTKYYCVISDGKVLVIVWSD